MKITIILGIVMLIAGCIGSPGMGGVGGQGISISAESGSSISEVHIWITDGGTDAALRYKSAATQPAE